MARITFRRSPFRMRWERLERITKCVAVTIPATKGRIMRYRPRFNEWGARFDLLLDDNALDAEMAHQLLNEAGQSIGIGDFRPEKRGPFGTFRVVRFEEQTP